MEIQISKQLLAFGQSILLGAATGVLYDLLRPLRLRIPRFTNVWDGAYCLIVGLTAFRFLLKGGDGELRGFLLLGGVGGAVLFFCTVSKWLCPVWEFWTETFAYMLYLLSRPLLWGKKFCKKTICFAKNLFYFARKCYTINKSGKSVGLQRRKPWQQKNRKRRVSGRKPAS